MDVGIADGSDMWWMPVMPAFRVLVFEMCRCYGAIVQASGSRA